MTNEAKAVLDRIILQDHIAAVLAARSLISDDYVDNVLVAELHDVAEYLREQFVSAKYPTEGSK